MIPSIPGVEFFLEFEAENSSSWENGSLDITEKMLCSGSSLGPVESEFPVFPIQLQIQRVDNVLLFVLY